MKQVTAGALFVRMMKSLPHSVQILPLRWYSKPAQPASALQRIWHSAAVLGEPRYNCWHLLPLSSAQRPATGSNQGDTQVWARRWRRRGGVEADGGGGEGGGGDGAAEGGGDG